MEKTLVIIKPDALQRHLLGLILSRFEQKGLKILALKMLSVTKDLAERMYAEHEGRNFHKQLMAFMTSGPVVAAVLSGREAISVTRKIIGPTFGPEAPPGTVRGDFVLSRRFNLVHASDSPDSAEREISLLFSDDELIEYDLDSSRWIYDESERNQA